MASRYVLKVTYQDPHTQNCRNIITESRSRVVGCMAPPTLRFFEIIGSSGDHRQVLRADCDGLQRIVPEWRFLLDEELAHPGGIGDIEDLHPRQHAVTDLGRVLLHR